MVYFSLISTLSLLTLSIIPSFAFDANSKENIAVYWGQSSAGSEQSLSDYCKSSDADIFLLSFLSAFPDLNLDLSSSCSGTSGCSSLGQDIETCQQEGKIVLLSLGGATGQYGFSGDDEGEQFAQTLWDTFGGGSGDNRPFGDAVVDGFDFDIENQNSKGYAALARSLKKKFQEGNKQFYISAAPQCVYPDASVGDLLGNAEVDFAFIQFYNNYCSVDKQFNWDTWQKFAENSSPNKDIKLFLGLPGSSSAAGSGYISDMSTLKSTISDISGDSNFGGVSLWDASQAFDNKVDGQSYISGIKDALGSGSQSGSSSAAPSSSAASTSAPASGSYESSSSDAPTATASYGASSSVEPSAVSSAAPSAASSVAPTTTPSFGASSGAASSVAPTDTPSFGASSSAAASFGAAPSAAPSASSSVAPTAAASFGAASTATPSAASTATSSVSASNTYDSAGTRTTLSPSTSQASTAAPSKSVTTLAPSSSSTSSGNDAHSQAVSLNQKYSNGYTDQDQCNSGEIACTPDGSLATCDSGSWVKTQCASGTTCFAYDFNNSVYSGCYLQNLKSNFLS